MCTTPKKHTKKRETLGNAKQNKITRRTEYKKVHEKNTQWKHSELKEHYEMLNKTKTTTAREKTKENP